MLHLGDEATTSYESQGRKYETDNTRRKGRVKEKLKGLQGQRDQGVMKSTS
jgi:hypothetical protein